MNPQGVYMLFDIRNLVNVNYNVSYTPLLRSPHRL